MEELLQVALCEDKESERERLLTLIQTEGIPVQVSVFESGETFLQKFWGGVFDLIFMDIYMDGISGVEIVQRIRETDGAVPIAFTTASQDHALDGYRLNVAKYIEKPVTRQAVGEMLRLAQEKKQRQAGIAIRLRDRIYEIPVSRVVYVEQQAHYIIFHYVGSEVEKKRGKLDELEPQLKGLSFFRCHKSYLANLSFVTGIDRELMVFHMKGGQDVYIRRENFKKAREAWENLLFAEARRVRGADA